MISSHSCTWPPSSYTRRGPSGPASRPATDASSLAQPRTQFDPPAPRKIREMERYGNAPPGINPNLPFDGRRMRQLQPRRTVDPTAPTMVLLKDRIFRHGVRHAPASTANHDAAITDLRAPAAYLGSACSGVCSKFVHTSSNKDRCPVNVCVWTSEGRRLLTGTHNGMFTLWSGLSFNFETTQQAHETAVRVAVWSHREEWMISGDHAGILKYWQTTLNCVKEFEAHPDTPIRDLAYCPTDAKYATCADDSTVKVWDFERGSLDRLLVGKGLEGKSHGWDVKCLAWHPQKALIVSGSKDNSVKVWDPKQNREVRRRQTPARPRTANARARPPR